MSLPNSVSYEGASIATAIHEFLEEGTPHIEPAVLDALRDLSTPLYRPSLENGIPVFPRAAGRLMQTSAGNTSAFELESIVCTDPVFAALLLGAANSGFFGGRWAITHISQAILRIGVPFARKLLLSACVGQLFSSGALAQLWRHSKTVACLAHEFAEQCSYDQEVAYAAGLLHDIGRIATRRASPAVRAGESAWIAAGFPLVYAETLTYGCDHAELGADLLAQWNLPLEIVEAVRLHHRPESARTRLAGILYMAEEEAAERTANPESLSVGVRGAWASQITGIAALPEGGMNRESAIFVLA